MAEPQSLNIRTDIKFSRNKTRVGCSFFKKIFGGVIAILYESTLPYPTPVKVPYTYLLC
jgi:hypothetical protein